METADDLVTSSQETVYYHASMEHPGENSLRYGSMSVEDLIEETEKTNISRTYLYFLYNEFRHVRRIFASVLQV